MEPTQEMSLHRRPTLPGRRWTGVVLALGAAALLSGCVTTLNYLDPEGPRYAGVASVPPASVSQAAGDSSGGAPIGRAAPGNEGADGHGSPRATAGARPPSAPVDLLIGSFNVQFGEQVEGALQVIRSTPELAAADFLLLQEMDSDGVRRIAEALGMAWVYYPAALRNGQEFGNAVLSRWPIQEDEKVLLPHESFFGGSRRIATAVTAQVGEVPVRVYSVHLATPLNQSREEREDQFRAVLDDAEDWPHVVIGGDLNSGSLPEMAVARGYAWPTREGPWTVWFSRVDHVLYRGLVPVWFGLSGTVTDEGEVSDHHPVWARGRVR